MQTYYLVNKGKNDCQRHAQLLHVEQGQNAMTMCIAQYMVSCETASQFMTIVKQLIDQQQQKCHVLLSLTQYTMRRNHFNTTTIQSNYSNIVLWRLAYKCVQLHCGFCCFLL